VCTFDVLKRVRYFTRRREEDLRRSKNELATQATPSDIPDDIKAFDER
jgi:hypothetical protein